MRRRVVVLCDFEVQGFRVQGLQRVARLIQSERTIHEEVLVSKVARFK